MPQQRHGNVVATPQIGVACCGVLLCGCCFCCGVFGVVTVRLALLQCTQTHRSNAEHTVTKATNAAEQVAAANIANLWCCCSVAAALHRIRKIKTEKQPFSSN